MDEQNYFQKALHSFVADMAYVQSVRHLYDKGMSEEQIKRNCSFPVSDAQIHSVIEAYEQEKKGEKAAFEYVSEIDEYGKRSYRRVMREPKKSK